MRVLAKLAGKLRDMFAGKYAPFVRAHVVESKVGHLSSSAMVGHASWHDRCLTESRVWGCCRSAAWTRCPHWCRHRSSCW